MTQPTPQPKRPRGRPKGTTKPAEEHLITIGLTIRPDQKTDLKALGGSRWLRQQIDAALGRKQK